MEVISGSVCRACRSRLGNHAGARTFSTSVSRQAVPPESPYYVDVPPTLQPIQEYRPIVRGILPVPRELFPANRPEKSTPEYIENVVRNPLPENMVPDSQLTELGRYRARMSSLRRTQLRESLTALHARKQTEIAVMGKRSQAKQLQRSLLLSQAEREDARLTNVSIPKQMDPSSHSSLESLHAELEVARRQHESKLINVANHAEETKANKMDALHTLYMNARHFVTTEDQLNQLVRDQFDIFTNENGEMSHAHFKNDLTMGSSMWAFGPPESISDKITGRLSDKKVVQNRMEAISNYSASRFGRDTARGKTKADKKFVKDQERFKRIAEKLSGGKI